MLRRDPEQEKQDHHDRRAPGQGTRDGHRERDGVAQVAEEEARGFLPEQIRLGYPRG